MESPHCNLTGGGCGSIPGSIPGSALPAWLWESLAPVIVRCIFFLRLSVCGGAL